MAHNQTNSVIFAEQASSQTWRDRRPYMMLRATGAPDDRQSLQQRSDSRQAIVGRRTTAGQTIVYLPTLPRISVGKIHTGFPGSDASAEELFDTLQKQTLRYFWDFAHPTSGLALERSDNWQPDVVTTGGSGFGVMAILVGVERRWIGYNDALDRLLTIVHFLRGAERYHGAFPHWMDGNNGRTVPFSPWDDGGDLVETSFLIAGLLSARQYFRGAEGKERELRNLVDELWSSVEWDWYTNGSDALFWHWSPTHQWAMNNPVRGWNECLLTFVLAASAPRHAIHPNVYHHGWAINQTFLNGGSFDGISLPLGPECGGPLFFAHYSFLGLDPRRLADRYADYWHQNVAHTLINRAHCINNPNRFDGYGADCWGLTASDSIYGYAAHAPDHDIGVIAPTAALSSLPYTPTESLQALRHFARLGDRLWGEYGFRDAFSAARDWYADSYLAIDQGPPIVMIENHRSGLLWRLFMSCPEIREGLSTLGFSHEQRPRPSARRTQLARTPVEQLVRLRQQRVGEGEAPHLTA